MADAKARQRADVYVFYIAKYLLYVCWYAVGEHIASVTVTSDDNDVHLTYKKSGYEWIALAYSGGHYGALVQPYRCSSW